MEEECRREPWIADVEIRHHGLGHVPLRRICAASLISYRMKLDAAGTLNLLAALRPDDVGEVHQRCSRRRWNRFQVSFDVVEKPGSYARDRFSCRWRLRGEEGMGKSNRLAGAFWGGVLDLFFHELLSINHSDDCLSAHT